MLQSQEQIVEIVEITTQQEQPEILELSQAELQYVGGGLLIGLAF